jgi:peptide/nickel transport system permease protein
MKREITKQMRNVVAVALLLLLLPLLVNHRPLYLNYKGEHFFPAFSGSDVLQSRRVNINLQLTDFRMKEDATIVMPLIPWSPGRSDLLNSYAGPFDQQYILNNGAAVPMPFHYRHWLGTDGRGADVLAGIAYGFRYSVWIALLAIFIAGLPGILLGSISGYYGNSGIRISKAVIPACTVALLYLLCTFSSGWKAVIFSALIYMLVFGVMKLFLRSKCYLFPADTLIRTLMEVMVSIPALIVIITLAAITRPGITTVAVTMGILLWPDIIRFTRAQVLQVKEEDYILAASSLGYKDSRIIFRHILKNGITPVLILLCFSFGNVILTEAALSFLGAGIPSDVVTWGSLLASGKENFQAWWLIIFPGVLLMSVVYYLVSFADKYQQYYRNHRI